MEFTTELNAALNSATPVMHETWVRLRCQAISAGKFGLVRDLFNIDKVIKTYVYDDEYVEAAIAADQLAILIWLHSIGVCIWRSPALGILVKSPEMQAWLMEVVDCYHVIEDARAVNNAILCGDLALVQKLHSFGYTWPLDCLDIAIAYNRTKVLEWLVKPRDYNIYQFKITYQFADTIYSDCESSPLEYAEMIKWLAANFNKEVVDIDVIDDTEQHLIKCLDMVKKAEDEAAGVKQWTTEQRNNGTTYV